MKKTYEKPVVAKVADLPRATAQRYGISGYYCPPYEICAVPVPLDEELAQ